MPIYGLDSMAPELPADGSFWLAPNATLIGKVRLARNTSIWFGAVLRGDNDWITIGEGSNVQDGSVFHTDAGIPANVGRNVTIGHAVVFHGATIGDNCIIGMGATLLNGARVGANSIVGCSAPTPSAARAARAAASRARSSAILRALAAAGDAPLSSPATPLAARLAA